jgi:hypothetical protein
MCLTGSDQFGKANDVKMGSFLTLGMVAAFLLFLGVFELLRHAPLIGDFVPDLLNAIEDD